jgi:PAS domain-containing protein
MAWNVKFPAVKHCFAFCCDRGCVNKKRSLSLSTTESEVRQRKAPFLQRFGLVRSSDPPDNDAFTDRVKGLARMWPIVAIALILGHAPMALQGESFTAFVALVTMAAFAILPFGLWFVPRLHQAQPHRHVLVISMIALAIGVCSVLIIKAGDLDRQSWSQIMFLGGSAIIVAAALTRLPAALVALLASLTAGTLISVPSFLTTAISIALLLCMLIVAFELARSEFAASRKMVVALQGASRPLRLLEEVEERGTVWFWETDRHARITYLSPKIAASLGWKEDDVAGRSRPLWPRRFAVTS